MQHAQATLLRGGFGLLEAPVFDPARGLLFTDAARGGVHCLDAAGGLAEVVPHRTGIGGMALHALGGVVVSGRNVAYKAEGAPTAVLLPNAPEAGVVGFNDLTTDPQGRVYVGSLGYRPTVRGDPPRPGALHLIYLDGSSRIVAPDVAVTNGLGFSPDGRRLYHSDTQARVVYVYDVLPDGGLADRRVFARFDEGMPDGLAVAADGAVWVAAVHAGAVLVFDAAGSPLRRFRFPVPMVTSLCFGGADLRDVYVVSGSEGSGREDAGAIFRLRSDAPGLPRPLARVAVPAGGGLPA